MVEYARTRGQAVSPLARQEIAARPRFLTFKNVLNYLQLFTFYIYKLNIAKDSIFIGNPIHGLVQTVVLLNCSPSMFSIPEGHELTPYQAGMSVFPETVIEKRRVLKSACDYNCLWRNVTLFDLQANRLGSGLKISQWRVFSPLYASHRSV